MTHALKIKLSFIALVIVFTAALAWQGVTWLQVRHLTHRNHTQLCKIEANAFIKARADRDGARAILKENPKGIPGFPKPRIEAAIADDQATMDANADKTCPPIPPPKKPG